MAPRDRYVADLERPGFHTDPYQEEALDCLQEVYEGLVAAAPKPVLWRRLLGRRSQAVRGLYLWGGPGRGKTYLMDCFFESLPFPNKRRVHFHRFMLEIHAALATLPKTPDPLPIIAQRLAEGCRVLCLDEFHVTDIADAMLLAGLLHALFERRVTLVTTSNTAPHHLYRQGLQRDRFLPAVELLLANSAVHHLGGARDFRLELLQNGGTYRVADGVSDQEWMRIHMLRLTSTQPRWNTVIEVLGRDLQVRGIADDVAWFDFTELCRKARSARDYLELAREFHTLLLEGIPSFNEQHDEAARRFIHLIDALYDHGVKCILVAQDSPHRLYAGGRLEKAFERTASRLAEMSCESYLARPHRPD
jgi:cell division protein ZapE